MDDIKNMTVMDIYSHTPWLTLKFSLQISEFRFYFDIINEYN